MNEERDVIGEVISEDNARPIHPAVAEYAVAALHTATSDGERVAELELLNKELWRQNEALTQRLAGGGEMLEVVATIECLDESTAYIESRSKRINVDNAVCNDALVFESDAKALIAQRDARIEEQAREIERLKAHGAKWLKRAENWSELKAQPSGVVLPERAELDRMWREIQDSAMRSQESPHIRFAEQLARLNSSPVSAGVMFGFDDRSVMVSQEAYQIFMDREHAYRESAALNAGSAVPDGWRLVPVDATTEMVEALKARISCTSRGGILNAGNALNAAIAAAPTAKKEG